MASNVMSQFNEILSSFLIQIVPIVGSTYHNNIQKIIKYNCALPIENFLYYAIEFRDKILTRDEETRNLLGCGHGMHGGHKTHGDAKLIIHGLN
jgi:hypothetical protein